MKTIQMRLPEGLLDEIDQVVTAKGSKYANRTDFVKIAIHKELMYLRAKKEGRIIQYPPPKKG